MRRAIVALLLPVLVGCAPRHAGLGAESRPLTPPPPPPPGSIHMWGPLRAEEVVLVRTEVGWERELVRGERLATFDVVVAQERATCPTNVRIAQATDAEGCRGAIAGFPASCRIEPKMRARFEATVRWTIDFAHRCAGDALAWSVPASGDARAALTNAGSTCFRTRNRFKPEVNWTSLYALTELTVRESVADVDSPGARLLTRLLTAPSSGVATGAAGAVNAQAAPKASAFGQAAPPASGLPSFCRDDGAYLDGSPGAPQSAAHGGDPSVLAAALVSQGHLDVDAGGVPLTAVWRSEHDLWEACHALSGASAPLVAQERCQLLRQLDRFVRDVEDLARPETPKGSGGGAPIASASASGSTAHGPPGPSGKKP